jgi:hypothetical protein
VPAFEIVSVPVELEVVRPLDLQLRVRRPLATGVPTRLSDLFDVTLVNRSNGPVRVTEPTLAADARLELEIDGAFGGWRPTINTQRRNQAVTRALKPGESAALLGKGELANLDGTWTYPKAGVVRVRAVYRASTWKAGPTIRSKWVEVKVEGEPPAGGIE